MSHGNVDNRSAHLTIAKVKNHTENKGEEGAGGWQCSYTTNTSSWNWRTQCNYLISTLSESS